MTCKHPTPTINRVISGWMWAYCRDCRKDVWWQQGGTYDQGLAAINFFKANLS